MRRASPHLLICALLVATGVTLLGLGALVTAPRPTFPTGRANTTLVRDFYDAVNRTLATGDSSGLAAVVAPDFVGHDLLASDGADLTAFAAYLGGLHAAFADLQLEVEEVVAGRDVVMTRVSLDGGDEGALAAVPLAAPVGFWGAADRFRIAGDRIAEFWSEGSGGGELRALFASLPFETAPGTAVLVDDFRLDWGEGLQSSVPLLVYLDAGALELAIVDAGRGEGRAPQLPSVVRGALETEERGVQMVASGQTIRLLPGDLLRIPTGAVTYRLWVPDGQTAVGFKVELVPPVAPPPETAMAAAPPRATVFHTESAHTAGASQAAIPPPPAPLATESRTPWVVDDGLGEGRRWTAGRITLGPGAALTLGAVPGAALLAVESGSLAMEVVPAAGQPSTAGAAVLRGGETGLLAPGERAALRNVGGEPVTVLVVALVG